MQETILVAVGEWPAARRTGSAIVDDDGSAVHGLRKCLEGADDGGRSFRQVQPVAREGLAASSNKVKLHPIAVIRFGESTYARGRPAPRRASNGLVKPGSSVCVTQPTKSSLLGANDGQVSPVRVRSRKQRHV